MAKRFTPETKEKARAMRASGSTYAAIAKELGCTAPCVRFWCDEQARVENGGRAKENWVRVSHQEGYSRHMSELFRAENPDEFAASSGHYTGLKRCGAKSSDISKVEADAIKQVYMLARTLTKDSGYPHEVDHIVPVCKGGEHRIWNLRIVPRYMNRTGRPGKGI